MKTKEKILLIGVGNEACGDDGAGLFIARRFDRMHLPYVKVIEETGEGSSLMEAWKDSKVVFLFDATLSQATPGSIRRIDVNRITVPKEFFNCSTHAFGVAQAVELARTLNQLPSHMIVFGIEGEKFSLGSALSPKVNEAIREVVNKVLCEIDEMIPKIKVDRENRDETA